MVAKSESMRDNLLTVKIIIPPGVNEKRIKSVGGWKKVSSQAYEIKCDLYLLPMLVRDLVEAKVCMDRDLISLSLHPISVLTSHDLEHSDMILGFGVAAVKELEN